MPLLSLDVRPPDQEASLEERILWELRHVEPLKLSYPEVSGTHLPTRGLLFSVVVHEVVIVLIVLLTFTAHRTRLMRPAGLDQTIDLSSAKGIVYLPMLGGGHEGEGHAGGSPGPEHKSTATAPSQSSKGMSFPGPQNILSNPPNATEELQTVLHPGLEKPKPLKHFVPLPNIVKMGHSALPLPKDLVAENHRPNMPEFHPKVAPVEPTMEHPNLTLPEPDAPAPLRPAKEAKRAKVNAESAPRISKLPANGADLDTIVALSPTPAMPQALPKIPEGEAHGAFAVSPEANVKSQGAPGGKAAESASTPALGKGAGTNDNAVGGGELRIGNAAGTETAGGGSGTGTGVGADKGSGMGGTGSQSAHGVGSGTGVGTGPGTSSASGAGAGSGAGKGSFSGITIHGTSGAYGTGAVIKSKADGIKLPPQTAYGMTIVSLAKSGGGLADYGVFEDEKIYTVFLDMRATPDDPAPTWTLEYALLEKSPHESDSKGDTVAISPPFPVKKEVPPMNAELMRRYLDQVIAVYAVMNTEGRLEQLAIKGSPDERFNQPILASLRKWSFRPAKVDGKPVAVKILIGIPVLPFEE